MAAQVVLDVPDPDGRARLNRVSRPFDIALGWLLTVAGLVAAALVFEEFFPIPGRPERSGVDIRTVVVGLTVTTFGGGLGAALVRGHHLFGLYLRKFGYGEATAVVTQSLTTAVGNRARLVTLDDAMAAPVGADRTMRRAAARVFFVAFGLWASARAVLLTVPLVSLSGGILVVAIATALPLCIAAYAGVAYTFAGWAQRFLSRPVDSEPAIASIGRRAGRVLRLPLSPRLVVVRVVGALWQRAVYQLGAGADVIIIDVSHPTDAVLWEVQTMRALAADRCVLVGAYDLVAPLADPSTAAGQDRRASLARLVDGAEVIAYGPSPQDHQRFAAALRTRLYLLMPRRGSRRR